MAEFHLFQLDTPQKWQAGTSKGVPFYFDCGNPGCKNPEDAVIFGYMATDEGFENIAVLTPVDKSSGLSSRLAMFCETCFKIQLAKGANDES